MIQRAWVRVLLGRDSLSSKPLFSTAQELLQRAGDRGSSSQEGEAVSLSQEPAARKSQCCP